MKIKELIKTNLKKMNYDLRKGERYWKTSSGSMILLKELKKIIPKYSGKIVLASNVGGNPEVIEKSNLFEAKNPEELKNIILKSINSSRHPSLPEKFHLSNTIKLYGREVL